MGKDAQRTVNASRVDFVGTKYPAERKALLLAIQKKRGDVWLSDTVRAALDALIEEHYPGAIRDAA